MPYVLWVRRLLPALILLAAACSGLAGEPAIVATIPGATRIPPEPAFPSAAPDLAAGAQVFAARCASCHGSGGAGDGELVLSGQVTAPANFTQPTSARGQTPRQWFDTITNGRMQQLMPPWRDALSPQQRWDVTLYTYTMHYSLASIARGEALWTANCGENCNSLAGVGGLADQEALARTSDDALHAAVMGQVVDDAAAAWDVVAYLRTQAVINPSVIGQQFAGPAATEEAVVAQVPAETEEAGAEQSAQPATPAAGAETTAGLISGQITLGTAGSELPSGLEVRLFRWTADFTPLETLTTMTDAEGQFRFEDLSIEPNYAYAVSVNYRDRRFVSQFARGASAADGQLNLPVTVYDATEDPSVLTITGVVNQMTAVANSVQVVQVINFRNSSDRIYTTSNPVEEGIFASVVLNLPPGATVVGFPNSDQRFVVSEDQSTVVDTAPVYPGTDHVIQMVYLLPYEGDAIIEQPLNYELDGQVRVLLRPDNLEVISEILQPIGPQTVGENTYKGYGGTLNLDVHEPLRFELRGAPAPAAAQVDGGGSVSSNNVILIVVGVLILQAVVIGGLYFFYQRRRGATPAAANTQASKEANKQDKLIDGLVGQIAELDAAHEKGEINHDVYQRQRQKLKARLAEIMEDGDGGSK